LVSWPTPADREQLRRRVLAFAGIWFLATGTLAAAGIFAPLLISLAVLVLGGCAAGGFWIFRSYQLQLGRGARSALTTLERASKKSEARLDELKLGRHVKHAATQASHRARTLLEVRPRAPELVDRRQRALRLEELGLGRHVKHAASLASHRARTLLEVRPRDPEPVDRRQHALRLNERGAQLRREGEYEQAAEQHRAALTIARELQDKSMEALTLNNLALAVVHTGGVPTAVQHFEEALVLLRELGDEEHEGQVIANLGFVRHRQGRDEDAATLLSEALDKLPPESPAYRHVEKQLRRAS
jgi:tetratricopeptide (TPR) repeat protein